MSDLNINPININTNLSGDFNKGFEQFGTLLNQFLPFEFRLKKELEKACLEGNQEKIYKIMQSADLLHSLGLVHIKQFDNIQSVLRKTQPHLNQADEIKNIDPKKRDKILDAIRFEYEDEAQEIWAKLIAGEINSPGSFSVRTIDILKNLSKEEAELLESKTNYIDKTKGSICYPDFFKNNSVFTFAERLTLVNAGLLLESSLNYNIVGMCEQFEITKGSVLSLGMHFNSSLIEFKGKAENTQQISIPVLLLANEARELLTLVKKTETINIEYIKYIANQIKPYFEDLEITQYFDVVKNNNSFNYKSFHKINLEETQA